ncbi:hypothetical protein [Clostridium cellulovorans]|uniref:DUF4064 domain-containing protein n=1 Tax=Clostridium cellulovorans (strain ATCC 35296 / DSM 3052 / OCM 3 / 743B) TaxID=573061 RepID=D9SS90_CLOC7|nr:hypothetical protein [Clostridium cellulovorans]ADL52537.1 hypothetical protein Clocel_2841 [Clostridium cellulovorans 743B]
MEYNVNYNKVGAGIITISVLSIIGAIIFALGSVILILSKDIVNETYASMGIPAIKQSDIMILLISAILTIIFIALILAKKSIGVFGYFATKAFYLVYTIISTGFAIGEITYLILPLLMLLFIVKKKHIYGFGNKNEDASI